jgi:hypothetical protein
VSAGFFGAGFLGALILVLWPDFWFFVAQSPALTGRARLQYFSGFQFLGIERCGAA